MSDDRVELKPCPWCSATPVVEHVNIGDCKWRCSCPNWNECEAQPETFGETAKQATEAWNTRALDPSIESLQAEVAELRKQRLMILTAVYPEAPKFVATICDESLDRSGALLGEVRELGRQALAAKEQTHGHQ